MDYEIQIVRSRRKTVSLAVERDGRVIVRAPYGVSVKRISDFVAGHRLWIERRLSERKDAPVLSFGGKVALFGREYTVREGKPCMTETEIFLPEENAEGALSRILKRAAQAYLGNLTQEIARKYGFSYAAVRISSARSRWGSCNSKGTIAYTYRMAFLPEPLCLYVVVHELSHTRYMNHGRAFWREAESVLPDCKRLRAQLKEYSSYMQPVRLEKNGKIL